MLARPQGPLRLNRAHPLASQCTILVAPEGDTVVDLVTGLYGVKAVSASLSTAYVPAFGRCLKSVSGSASGLKYVSAQSAAKLSTSGLLFGAFQFTNVTTAAAFFATSSAASGMRFEVNSGNIQIFQTGSTSTTATVGLVADVPYFLSIRWDGSGSSVIATRLDSGYTIRATAAAIGASSGDQTLVVAGRIGGATALPGYLGLTGLISDSGVATGLQRCVQESLHLDPWGLIRPDGYRRPYFTSAPAGADRNASASVTLAGVTRSATGALTIKADAARTLAGVSRTATGTLTIKASASQALAAITRTATGALTVKGTVSATLGAVVQVGTGKLVISASNSSTLAAILQTATGTISSAFDRNATAVQTLTGLTHVATGKLIITGQQ